LGGGGRTAAVIIDRTVSRVRPDDEDFYGAVSVTIGLGGLLEGAGVDLGEAFSYYGVDGTSPGDWFDPTETAAYNGPPSYQWPVAARAAADEPDAQRLGWVEGPVFDGATNGTTGGWSLVLADAANGTEMLRLDLGQPGDDLVHADLDGRFWVGTSADTFDAEPTPVDSPARVVIVDTGAPTPTVVDAGCPPGVTATIDRLDTEAPPPPTPSAPTTTVAPTPPPTTSAPSPHGSDDLPGVHQEHGHVPGQVVPDGRRGRQRAPRAPIRTDTTSSSTATSARPPNRQYVPSRPTLVPRSTAWRVRTRGPRSTLNGHSVRTPTATAPSTRGKCSSATPTRATSGNSTSGSSTRRGRLISTSSRRTGPS